VYYFLGHTVHRTCRGGLRPLSSKDHCITLWPRITRRITAEWRRRYSFCMCDAEMALSQHACWSGLWRATESSFLYRLPVCRRGTYVCGLVRAGWLAGHAAIHGWAKVSSKHLLISSPNISWIFENSFPVTLSKKCVTKGLLHTPFTTHNKCHYDTFHNVIFQKLHRPKAHEEPAVRH